MGTHNLTKHKTREVTHDQSNHEYHLVANHAHLHGLQVQFCYARPCFVFSDFFFNNSDSYEVLKYEILT